MATAEITPNVVTNETATQLEIVVNRKELLAELAAAVGVVETKTTIPILTNLLLDASKPGSAVRIAATNLSQGLDTSLPAKIKAHGVAAIPARKLYDYVRLLAGEDVTIRQESNHHIRISCGRSKTRMVGTAPASFPKLSEPESWKAQFAVDFLRPALERVLVSVSATESRYTLNGALLEQDAKGVRMVSTDGHRLSRVSKGDGGEPLSVVIPAAALKELVKLMKDGGASVVSFAENDKTMFFQVGTRTLSSARISGQFPAYQKVFPNFSTPGVMLDVPSVLQSLNRCLLFADERSNAVKLSLQEKTLEISAACAEVGRTEELHDILGGPQKEVAIGYNGEYIRDVLSIASESVEFQFKDGSTPALFTHRQDDGLTLEVVIMPMRLGDAK